MAKNRDKPDPFCLADPSSWGLSDGAKWARTTDLVTLEVLHQSWGSQVGRLWRLGHIGREEWEGALRFHDLHIARGRIDRLDPDDFDDTGKANIDRIKKQYTSLMDGLRSLRGGAYVKNALISLIIFNEATTGAKLRHAVTGLEAMAYFFGLKRNKR